MIPHQEIYRRKVGPTLIILRCFFPLALASCLFFFIIRFSTIGYVLAITIFFSSFIRIINIIIGRKNIQVTKYYFFGLIPIQFSFRKRKIPRIRLVRDFDNIDVPDEPSSHLPLYLLMVLFIRVKVLLLTFEYINCAHRKLWERITINENEFQLISKYHLRNV